MTQHFEQSPALADLRACLEMLQQRIPEWSLLGFIGMLLFSAYLLLRRR